jgi:hypothetical protein
MHYLMLITFTMLPGETSQQARDRSHGLLVDEPSSTPSRFDWPNPTKLQANRRHP